MSIPRRLVRLAAVSAASRRQRQVQRLRERLELELAALARSQRRLQLAFTLTKDCQQRIVRIEQQLTRLEE